jgi:hypothetical protein
MALGHCSHEHYPVLFEELPSLVEEYTRTKQRRGTAARPEEVCWDSNPCQLSPHACSNVVPLCALFSCWCHG